MSYSISKKRDNSRDLSTEKQLKEKLRILKERFEILEAQLNSKEEQIPLTIFSNKKLSSLETIVKFLKENRELNFTQIANILNRDPRTIWTTYTKAKKKLEQPFKKISSKHSIPVSALQDRSLGALESICLYLKDSLGLTTSEIALALKRSSKTIWASYHKAKTKSRILKNE
ncbi:hypothetical protein HZA98_00045 [Candidatus Woesearchaeota archaeon]|nr:hypothetical protein [Candidatus Woesearchaeota archaeon]